MLADIGDEQSIAQSLSTFSSHMVNIVGILGEADDETLILFDELGAGTDPKTRGRGPGRRHHRVARRWGPWWRHHPLRRAEGVRHDHNAGGRTPPASSTWTPLAPTYRLLIGIPGKSTPLPSPRGWACPCPSSRAAARIDAENVRFEDVLTQLDEQRQEMEREKEAAARLRREMEETAKASREYRAKMERRRPRRWRRPRRRPGPFWTRPGTPPTRYSS